MSEPPLEIHPQYERLLQENALLREELARLLTEEHDLLHIVKPNLLALYQKMIGAWELRGLQAQVAELRARRRLEMAQAALNQGRTANLAEIDGFLELEFLNWQQKLQEAADRLAAATERLAQSLPAVEARELKKVYYALVKKLHPDVNPQLTDGQRRLWLRVQAAYELRELAELQALALLAQEPASELPAPDTIASLRRDQVVLRGQIETILKRLEQWESQPPFTLRAQLEDEAWVAQRRAAIETRIAQLDAQRAGLDAQLRTLFPDGSHDTIFGLN